MQHEVEKCILAITQLRSDFSTVLNLFFIQALINFHQLNETKNAVELLILRKFGRHNDLMILTKKRFNNAFRNSIGATDGIDVCAFFFGNLSINAGEINQQFNL